jgi:formylglycine-generating enzyme required for sulfatase activity
MGCIPANKKNCENDEFPTKEVTLSEFLIGKYEVTQYQWEQVM